MSLETIVASPPAAGKLPVATVCLTLSEPQSEPFPITYDDVHSLALELCAHEGYTLGAAMRLAAADLGYALTLPPAGLVLL